VVAEGARVAALAGVAADVTVVLFACTVGIPTGIWHTLTVVLTLHIAAVARHAVAVSLAAGAILAHLAGPCGSVAAGEGLRTVQEGIQRIAAVGIAMDAV